MAFMRLSSVDWTLLLLLSDEDIAFFNFDIEPSSSAVMDRSDIHIPCTFSLAANAISFAFGCDIVSC